MIIGVDSIQNFVIRPDGVEFVFDLGTTIGTAMLAYNEIDRYIVLFGDTAAEAAPSTEKKPDIAEIATCTHNGVHVRAKADAKSDLLDTVGKGEKLEVITAHAGRGWTKIWHGERTAYIATEYIQLASEPENTAAPKIKEVGYVTGGHVHVRADATIKSTIIATLKEGDKVEIIKAGAVKGWDKIWYDKQVAYISAKYVSVGQKPTETPAEQPKIVDKGYVECIGTCTANGVVIRAKPHHTAAAFGKCFMNEEVIIVETNVADGWHEIFVPTTTDGARGFIGYVHAKYIAIGGVTMTAPGPAIGTGASAGPAIGAGASAGPVIGSGVTIG